MYAAKFTRNTSFNTERFIEEIKKRPSIWDTKCNGYADKNRKMNAWEEVFEIFIDDWQEMNSNERFVKARSVQRRWKSLRDCFRRELNLKSCSTSSSTRRPYLFYNQLKFLQPDTNCKDMENAAEASENEDSEDETIFEEVCIEPTAVGLINGEVNAQKNSETSMIPSPMIPITSSSRLFDQQMNEVKQEQTLDNQLLGVLTKSIEMCIPNPMRADEDQLFLLSLAGDLRKVPEQRKLLLKSEIINCILRAQQ